MDKASIKILMRKLSSIIALFLLFLLGCGRSTSENKPVANANVNSSNAAKTETNADQSSAPKAAKPIDGEKIEKPVAVKFAAGGFPEGWVWIDPDERYAATPHETKDGVLKMTIPSSKDMYGENRTAPRLLKAIAGDFQIETKVKFDPRASYQGAGLIVYSNDNNYLRLERAFGGVGGGESGIRLDVRKDAEYQPLTTPDDIPTEAKQVELKILRKGKQIFAFWRPDEDAEWKSAGEFLSDYPDSVQIGVIGCNTAAPITAEFAYINLGP
jgi:regulation of enolase protein 1 (concanavalin A-like superfamily)